MKFIGRVLELLMIAAQCSIVYGCTEKNIRNLTNLDLRGPNIRSDFLTIGSGIFLNDDEIPAGWYRTIYNGWQYTMSDVDNIPNFATCSTYWPIYLIESHPPIANLSEDPITVKACRRDIAPCTKPTKIKLRKCNEEVQYYLVRTSWYSAYCFEQRLKMKTLAPAPDNVNLGEIVVSPELNFKTSKDKNNQLWKIPFIIFWCKFNNQTGLYYSVNWYVDKRSFHKTLGPTQNLTELTLHEDILLSLKITLPVQLRCGVSASSNHDGLTTREKFSQQFYAGMKILKKNIYLDKESNATVQMMSTIPLGCKYFIIEGSNISLSPCVTEVKIFVDNQEDLNCSRLSSSGSVVSKVPPTEEAENQMCAKYIHTYNETAKWQPGKVENFTIVTTDHTYDDKSEFILKLEIGYPTGHKLWEDYSFPDVKIFVKNMSLYKNKICTAVGDPHMTTFDGYYYYQGLEGTFIMYLNSKYGIEVQHNVKFCDSNNDATCTCGVAVSAGQDIFMINRCGNTSFIGFTNCGDGGILDVDRVHDKLYRVFTPIGTRVEIKLSRTIWMDVSIYMAPKDMNHVFGLCGYADGNESNDLQHRNSDKVSPLSKYPYSDNIYHDFINSWMVKNQNESLFQQFQHVQNRKKWTQQNGLYCLCNSTNRVDSALCSPSQYLNCRKNNSITEMKCHEKGRRKRNTGDHSEKEIRRLLEKMQPINRRQKRDVREHVVISDEAIEFCSEKLNGILALNEFKNLSVNSNKTVVTSWCAFDLSVSNDTTWADVHIEAVNDGVKNMMDLQPTYVKTNTEKVEFFLQNTCPMNCTGRGNCSDSGVCSCFTYYHGPDCSIDERDALEISDIQGGGECDIAEGDECKCFYVRSDSIQRNITCSVATSKIAVNGDIVNISTDIIKGVFEDIFTGICCVPANIKDLEDVFVAKYGVQISNNGYNFGNEENVYVFDSTCQEVKNTVDGDKTFSLKEKHCFIQGFCFADDDMAPSGCLACVSSASLYSWTEYNPCKNGGNCSDDEIGYSCACVEGYGGINCAYEIDECESNPCLNGGVCSDKFNGYMCTCAQGFTGSNCEININECTSHPCQNSGLCIDKVNMYTCTCKAGYEGAQCEIEANECQSSPCQNGGTCSDEVNQYECSCREGYYGVNCQTKINNCDSNPCVNGATCTDVDNGRLCSCLGGFEGKNCELNINECSSSPCQNNGSCVDLVNGFTCTCKEGFEGSSCNINVDDCNSDPCQNGGRCVDLVNAFTCSCVDGFEGIFCERDINECVSSPCQNGGSCTDLINAFTCSCADGFDGAYCEININECSSDPCQNGGSCVDLVNGFTCKCKEGFEGDECESNINECMPNPCQNSGSCDDLVNRFTCLCAEGFEGMKCEKTTVGTLSTEARTVTKVSETRTDVTKSALVSEVTQSTTGQNMTQSPIKHEVTQSTTIIVDVTQSTVVRTVIMVFNITEPMDLYDPVFVAEVESSLTEFYMRRLEDKLNRVHVISLSSGSLVVNYEIEYENSEKANRDFLQSVIDLTSGKNEIVVTNESVSALSVEINNEKVVREMLTMPESVCDLFVAINGQCIEGSQCTLFEGSPTCVEAKLQEEYQIIVIASGCTGAFLLFAIVFVFIWRYKRRSPSYDLSAATRREFGRRRKSSEHKVDTTNDPEERLYKSRLQAYEKSWSGHSETDREKSQMSDNGDKDFVNN